MVYKQPNKVKYVSLRDCHSILLMHYLVLFY